MVTGLRDESAAFFVDAGPVPDDESPAFVPPLLLQAARTITAAAAMMLPLTIPIIGSPSGGAGCHKAEVVRELRELHTIDLSSARSKISQLDATKRSSRRRLRPA